MTIQIRHAIRKIEVETDYTAKEKGTFFSFSPLPAPLHHSIK